MEEIVKDIDVKKSNTLINGVVVVGLFATAFYLLFLRGNKAYSQSPEMGNVDPNIVDGVAVYGDSTVPKSFLEKKIFRGVQNTDQVVEGYEMPPDPNMLNWSSEKPIEVIVKPDVPVLWYYAKPMDKIKITRVEKNVVGNRRTPNNPNLNMRDYQKIMNEVVLVDSKDFNI